MTVDFQKVADSIAAMTCIVSVEKLADGSCGEIRIVTGNRSYIDSIEHPAEQVKMLTREFVPNSLYTAYMPRDLNFEDFCYRAAVQKKCLHSYAHPDRYNVWFNMTFLPLWPDNGNLCYCTYTMEINYEPSSERISNISSDIASAVLETALTLRGADDFKGAVRSAVQDVREMCEAEYCCILLVDDEKESCEVLGESYADDSGLRPDNNYLEADFYSVAKTWKDTISGSNCLIAKNDRDMEAVAQRNPVWCRSLRDAGVHTIALFPLKARNQHMGYMWASNFHPDRSARIKEILELTTFVLSSEIGNYLMMNRLKRLSSRDMLTGVMNRNEMNNYVERLSTLLETSKTPVSVIFTDLNGLKKVNDSQGHGAGDQLLKNAANVLCSLFDARNIFRAGGDEFVIILPGIYKQETENKVKAIHLAEAQYPDVSFAIGSYTEDDCRKVRHALMQADARMYEDKKRFYQSQAASRTHRPDPFAGV
jgi:diguanylate cyclase (GGDEF)-like protein